MCLWSTRRHAGRHPGSHHASTGAGTGDLHLLPTLWFRNTWSRWIAKPFELGECRTSSTVEDTPARVGRGAHRCREVIVSCEGDVPLLFTENETNT